MVLDEDTPTAAIARLDAALQRRGQAIVLRRYTAPSGNPRPKTDIPVRGFVRLVDDKTVKELVGDIAIPYFEVIVSPTDTAALLPIVRGDKIVIDGKERNVETPRRITMNNVLVRMKIMVAG